MNKLRLGETELMVSSLCYGVAPFGTLVSGAAMYTLYDRFREAGGNFFDTAHCYCFWIENGDGASERALGECLRQSGDRAEMVIATKGGHPAAGARYPRPDRYLAPEVIAGDIDDSLQRLGIERIDLYYLHRDDPRVPVGEIVELLNAEIGRGRIRHLGASNWTTQRIDAANAYAAAQRLSGFIASQPQWNLALPNESTDPGLRFINPLDEAWHRKHHFPVIAYSPTAQGYFASDGKLSAKAYDNQTSRRRLGRAHELAMKLGITPNQVALAFLMNQEFTTIPILGTTNPQHLGDAVHASAVRLTAEQLQWLRG